MPVPTELDFQRGRVTNGAQSEIIRQTLYDALLYAGAGQTSLTFFQSPVGQGQTTALGATATNPKSYADTNMALAGQLPNGQQMLVESVELLFFPGSVSTAATFTVDAIGKFAAANAATVANQPNDVSAFGQSGWLELNILAKNYLREAPLSRFPPKTHIAVNAALATTSATAGEVAIANAYSEGRAYYTDPELLLQPTMNFEIKLQWPGLVAMTSGFNARVMAVLDGYTMRASQ